MHIEINTIQSPVLDSICLKWRRVVDEVRTLIQAHNTEFNVFVKSVLEFQA